MTTKPIFDPAADGWHTAFVGEREAGWCYAWGFLNAADLLVEQAVSRSLTPDFGFYPICFLYRHAAEITLKQLVRDAEQLLHVQFALGGSTDARDATAVEAHLMKLGHRVADLLVHFEERLALVSDASLPTEHRDALVELDAFDRTGERFRYPRIAAPGKTTLPAFPDHGQYDVLRIRDGVGAAIRFLQDGAGSSLRADIDAGCEIIREYDAGM